MKSNIVIAGVGNEIPKAGTADQKIISKSSDKEIIMVAKEVKSIEGNVDVVDIFRKPEFVEESKSDAS